MYIYTYIYINTDTLHTNSFIIYLRFSQLPAHLQLICIAYVKKQKTEIRNQNQQQKQKQHSQQQQQKVAAGSSNIRKQK